MSAMEIFDVVVKMGGIGLLFGIFERLGGLRAAVDNLKGRVDKLENRKVILP